MNLIYPIKAIFIYFEILFAPPAVSKIMLNGPNEIVRTAG